MFVIKRNRESLCLYTYFCFKMKEQNLTARKGQHLVLPNTSIIGPTWAVILTLKGENGWKVSLNPKKKSLPEQRVVSFDTVLQPNKQHLRLTNVFGFCRVDLFMRVWCPSFSLITIIKTQIET